MSEQSIAAGTENRADSRKPVFTFQRLAGLDQAILANDAEWQNLDQLDSKLWLALSCPTHGLNFCHDTLALLDADNDGRIRASDVKAAVAWLCQGLRHPAQLRLGGAELSLDDFRDDTDEGQALALALRLVLAKNGKAEGGHANLAEIDGVLAEAAGYAFNGDGIVPPDSAARDDNPSMEKFISLGLSIVGGKCDASGKPGLDAPLADELKKRLLATKKWREAIKNTDLPLGEKTGQAWHLLQRLGPRIDDYFCRCAIAAFAPDAIAKLNEAPAQALEPPVEDNASPAPLNLKTLLAMPLARISQSQILDLGQAINPAWADDLENFRILFAPLLENCQAHGKLAEKEWKAIKQSFSGYAATLEGKPHYERPSDDAERIAVTGMPPLAAAPANDALGRSFLPLEPEEALSRLGDAEIAAMLHSDTEEAFAALAAKDLAAPPISAIRDLRKMALYHANLYTFLMNFLSFTDFYDPRKKAIFQAGTLYLDSRACTLCVPVADMDTHARLAARSCLCLIYCLCSRKGEDGSEQTATIAAALTQGNLVSLIEGKHGLFVDNDGREWDTRIARVAHNPISLREAMWAPYIRIANMASEQIQKLIAAKDNALGKATGKAVNTLLTGGGNQAGRQEAPKAGFDFAKGAGIFAAISVGLSVMSAAFAYIANSFVSLGWWWPLALAVIFLCISGPSVVMAWFKLRRRNLGSLLDASGWAVNQGAPINLLMGASLTSTGKLPANAMRDFRDPFGISARVKKRRRAARIWLCAVLSLLVLLGAFIGYCWLMGEPAWLLRLRITAAI